MHVLKYEGFMECIMKLVAFGASDKVKNHCFIETMISYIPSYLAITNHVHFILFPDILLKE